jgi:hypothetical protein
MKIGIDEAIAMANNGQSLQGVTIEGLNESQVKAMDALTLAKHGVVIPEQNIYYDDSEIAFDEDFDEVKWSSEPVQLTFEEKVELANRGFRGNDDEMISLRIAVADKEVNQWIKVNLHKVEGIISGLIVDLYKTRKSLRE